MIKPGAGGYPAQSENATWVRVDFATVDKLPTLLIAAMD